jgi:aminoglycoside phosphotransferase (APT) family kinase protein
MPVLTLPTDDAVVEFCMSNGRTDNGLAYTLDGGDTLWIKYGPHVTPAEARTQDHACKKINRMGVGVARIPEVYRFFVREGVTYIVMEYIEGETATQRCMRSADPRSVYNKLSDVLNQLLSITPPTTLPSLGPIGGGPVHHFFFADNVSAIEYDSVRTLEQQINSVRFNNLIFALQFIAMLS